MSPSRHEGRFFCLLKIEGKLMIKILTIACVTVPAIVVSAIAQQPAIKRTVLRSIDYPAGYTTVTVIVEIAPGTCSGRHTHPGIDSGYVIQGDFVRADFRVCHPSRTSKIV